MAVLSKPNDNVNVINLLKKLLLQGKNSKVHAFLFLAKSLFFFSDSFSFNYFCHSCSSKIAIVQKCNRIY